MSARDSVESDAAYEHRINVTIGGPGARPVMVLWCMDCLETVGDFEQITAFADVQQAVTGHCSRMSKRERLTAVTPPAEGSDR